MCTTSNNPQNAPTYRDRARMKISVWGEGIMPRILKKSSSIRFLFQERQRKGNNTLMKGHESESMR